MVNDIIAAVSEEGSITSLRRNSLAMSTAFSSSQSFIDIAGAFNVTMSTSPAALHTGSCASTSLRARAMEDWELPTIWALLNTLCIPCSSAFLILFPNRTAELGSLPREVPLASSGETAAASYPTRRATRIVSRPTSPAFWPHPASLSLLRCRKRSLRESKAAPQFEHSWTAGNGETSGAVVEEACI